jgi:hypothetical protein
MKHISCKDQHDKQKHFGNEKSATHDVQKPKKNKLESSPSKNLYVYIWDREEAGTGKTDDVQEWDRHLTW